MQQLNRFAGPLFLLPILLSHLSQHAVAVDLIGYLPYYRMGSSYNNNVLPTQLGMVNESRYLGVTAGSAGSIPPLAGSGTVLTHQTTSPLLSRKSTLCRRGFVHGLPSRSAAPVKQRTLPPSQRARR